MNEYPPVLDACCGSRMFWFDKKDSRALFMDRRRATYPSNSRGVSQIVIDPDVQCDFADMPFPDNTFDLVVFDPPHAKEKPDLCTVTKQYGVLGEGWQEMLRGGFKECFRVLRPKGTLVFKWAERHIKVSEVLALTDQKPLFGHRSGKASNTHWICFIK